MAERGGIRFITPSRISAFSAAVDDWTVANDENPSNPTTKPCLHVDCGSEQEVTITAITRCLEFGNLGARAYPEQVQDAIEKTIAWHARFAERLLLTGIGTNSTAVSTGEILGATRDVLSHLGRAAAQYRARHRTPVELTLRVVLPAWLLEAMKEDLVRQLPGDNKYAVADAEINGYFVARNISPVWALDQVTAALENSGTQNAGGLNPWPTEVRAYLFHEGAFLFVDGGQLDLGLVRDATLNETNDYRMFAETFENVAFVGLESIQLTMNICPNGKSSAAEDIDICAVGS